MELLPGPELQQGRPVGLRRVRLGATATGEVHLASGRVFAHQGLRLLSVSSQLSRAWNTTWPETSSKQISVNEWTV